MSWLNNNTTKHVGVPHGNIGRNNAPSIRENNARNWTAFKIWGRRDRKMGEGKGKTWEA